MSAINDKPPTYGFGLDFNYALWTKGTEISMVNVPWNNDYRDIVNFDTRLSLNAYIDSLETSGITIKDLSYVKPNQPIRIPVPFNSAYRYNYLRASNPLQPIPGDVSKDFYYFITDVRYIAPNTTEIVVQLDVWQTFGFDVTFGNSYIERGHIGIANEKAFDAYGRDYLTIPEGLDVGAEYRIIAKRKQTIMRPTLNDGYDILIASTVRLDGDYGTVAAPKLKSASGSVFSGLPSGAEYYVFPGTVAFANFMTGISAYPWISQGIISITCIPKITRYNSAFVYNAVGLAPTPAPVYPGVTLTHTMFANWRNSSEILNTLPARYRHLLKFLTYPYMVIEATTWSGTPIILKPESWADPDAKVIERGSMVPPNQRLVFSPQKYNASSSAVVENRDALYPSPSNIDPGDGDDSGEYIDLFTSINNFPAMAVVNNMAIGYMASNANAIPFQNQSADWSQQRALASNQTSYDQQSAGIEMSKSINALERAGMGGTVASNQQALLEGVAVNGMAGVGGAMMNGNLASGGSAIMSQVMGGVNAGISMAQQNRNLSNAQTVSKGSNTGQTNQAGYVRDTNKSLSDWAARGDYQNTIAGINAKVQDAKLTQPSTSGQIGGEAMNLINDSVELAIRWRLIDNAAIRAVGEHWLRYGYAVRQFAVPATLNVMSKFTYWKLSETYITSGAMPEYFKQAIRGIFEKGVTVWKTPSEIGNVDIGSNVPLGGFTL